MLQKDVTENSVQLLAHSQIELASNLNALYATPPLPVQNRYLKTRKAAYDFVVANAKIQHNNSADSSISSHHITAPANIHTAKSPFDITASTATDVDMTAMNPCSGFTTEIVTARTIHHLT